MKIPLKSPPKHIYVPLIILILGFVTFYTDQIDIVSDMGFYMNAGMNIHLGKGYTDTDGTLIIKRGPLFPLLLAASFWLFGLSPWSAFWIVRIFSILNPLAIYFIGKKFYGRWIGFAASLLVLSSFSLNYWSYRHLDAAWPFFVLLSIFTLYLAFEKSSIIHFSISAVLISLAYLIKQAPILLFPLPFLLWVIIGDFRNKKNFKGVVIFLLVIFTILTPWIYYVFSQTHNIKFAILGGFGETAASTTRSANIVFLIRNYISGIFDYFKTGANSLIANFSLTPLFMLSWLFISIKAIRKEKTSIILMVCIILLSPFISFAGRNNLRVGQVLLFIYLSYLVSARVLLDGLKKLITVYQRKFQTRNAIYRYIGVVAIIGVVFFQHFFSYKNDKGNTIFLKHSFCIKKITGRDIDWQIQGMYGKQYWIQDPVDWISAHIPKGSNIMCDWYWKARILYFYTQGNYPIHNMPIQMIYELSKVGRFLQRNKNCASSASQSEKKAKLIFLSSWSSILDLRNHFYILTESDLLRDLKAKKIEYLIISERRNFLSKYFNSNPGFMNKAEFYEGRIKIFKVKNIIPLENFKILITSRTIQFLNAIKAQDYTRYLWFKKNFFENALGWDEKELRMIEERNYAEKFEEVIIYKIY
jgi:4-amino-4-deoxy-L-arabinose transferase-like glycosyltransferase